MSILKRNTNKNTDENTKMIFLKIQKRKLKFRDVRSPPSWQLLAWELKLIELRLVDELSIFN